MFEIYTDTFDEFSFEELKDELEKTLNVSDISDKHLQDKIILPRIISACKKLENAKKTDRWVLHVIIRIC